MAAADPRRGPGERRGLGARLDLDQGSRAVQILDAGRAGLGARQPREQRQRAGRRNRRAQRLERPASARRSQAAVAEPRSMRASERGPTAAPCSTSAMPKASGIGRFARSGGGIIGVVGDQQHRRAVGGDLRQGLEQSGGEARVIGAQHGGGAPWRRWRCSSSRPRQLCTELEKRVGDICAAGCGEGRADLVAVLAVAARGGEHAWPARRARRRRVAAASSATRERQFTARPVRRRSAGGRIGGRRQLRWRRGTYGSGPRSTPRAAGQSGQARAEHADARRRRRGQAHRERGRRPGCSWCRRSRRNC